MTDDKFGKPVAIIDGNFQVFQMPNGETIHIKCAVCDAKEARIKELELLLWQAKGALGYPVPGHIPCGDFVCGLCDAKAKRIAHLEKHCRCGGVILADTEDWPVPMCNSCYEFVNREVKKSSVPQEIVDELVSKLEFIKQSAGLEHRPTYFYAAEQALTRYREWKNKGE